MSKKCALAHGTVTNDAASQPASTQSIVLAHLHAPYFCNLPHLPQLRLLVSNCSKEVQQQLLPYSNERMHACKGHLGGVVTYQGRSGKCKSSY